MYLIVKQTHLILALISVVFFQFRYWYFKVRGVGANKLTKILPHSIDTLLLLMGVVLAFMAGFSPFNSPWLLYKLLALLVYIVLGVLAMKKTGLTQWLSYFAATLAVIYLITVALTKNPWPL